MPQLRRPGAVVHYEIWGDEGDWVTLVNGHNRPLNDFRLLGRHLNGRGFRVLALDNRGAGRTEVSGTFALPNMVDDVVGLWDEEGIVRTHLVGVSMGGFIAQTTAVDYPERVRKLVLVSTAGSQVRIQRDETPWTADPDQVARKLAPYFTEDFARRNELLVRSMAKQIAKAVDGGRFAELSAMQRRAIEGFDLTGRLSEIKAPTLVIHGEGDRIIPVAAARELAAGIRGGRLQLLPGVGHLLLAESPRELYDLVSNWLTHDPSATA